MPLTVSAKVTVIDTWQLKGSAYVFFFKFLILVCFLKISWKNFLKMVRLFIVVVVAGEISFKKQWIIALYK